MRGLATLCRGVPSSIGEARRRGRGEEVEDLTGVKTAARCTSHRAGKRRREKKQLQERYLRCGRADGLQRERAQKSSSAISKDKLCRIWGRKKENSIRCGKKRRGGADFLEKMGKVDSVAAHENRPNRKWQERKQGGVDRGRSRR